MKIDLENENCKYKLKNPQWWASERFVAIPSTVSAM